MALLAPVQGIVAVIQFLFLSKSDWQYRLVREIAGHSLVDPAQEQEPLLVEYQSCQMFQRSQ